MSNLPTTAREKSQNLMMVLNARKDIFKDLLPKYLTPEKLFRVAQLAMSKNPALLGCSPASFVVAMMDSARCGLEPNGKDAALVPYGQDCQFQVMYQGLVKQAIRGGAVKKVVARLIYENDHFKLRYDPEWHLVHEPAQEDEGEVVGAYSYAILPDGSYSDIEYMNKRKLDHIKNKSRARSGPWQTDPEEMYRKTPVKRLFKYLPIPDEVEYAVQVDNLAENGRSRDDIPLLDKVPEDLNVPQTEKIKEKINRRKKEAEAPPMPPPPEQATEGKAPGDDAADGGTGAQGGPVKGIQDEQLEIIREGITHGRLNEAEILSAYDISALTELHQEAANQIIDKMNQ